MDHLKKISFIKLSQFLQCGPKKFKLFNQIKSFIFLEKFTITIFVQFLKRLKNHLDCFDIFYIHDFLALVNSRPSHKIAWQGDNKHSSKAQHTKNAHCDYHATSGNEVWFFVLHHVKQPVSVRSQVCCRKAILALLDQSTSFGQRESLTIHARYQLLGPYRPYN